MKADDFAAVLEGLGWNQKDAAKYLGVTEGAVSRWVHGKRKIPGPVRKLMTLKKKRKPAKV